MQQSNVDLFGGERPGPRLGRSVERLNAPSNQPFYYQHHPLRHDVVGRGQDQHLLPCLGVLSLEPGSQGIRESGSIDLCLEMQRRRGWQVLIPETDMPSSKLPEYRMRYPAKKGGFYHCAHWTAPRQVGGQMLPPTVDHSGYVAWLRTLLARGIIAPIERGVWELVRSRCARELRRAEQQAAKLARGETPRVLLFRSRLAIIDRGYQEQHDLSRLGTSARGLDRMAALKAELAHLEAQAAPGGEWPIKQRPIPTATLTPPPPEKAGLMPETRAHLAPTADPETSEAPLVPPESVAALTRGAREVRAQELAALSFADLRELATARGVTGRSSETLAARLLALEFSG